ncbi:MAG TPA: HAMP domain-containing protein, partial [Gallionella sp.]|nr:HAMP domain-containing protein [Gallionella sp.]
MTIKQKIHCVMLLSVALGLALGLIFLVAQRNVDAANAQEQDLSNISKSIFQLTLIGQDVSLHPNEFRARSQWLKQHRELGDMLRKIHIDAPQDNTVLERLRNAHKNQLRLFEMLRLLPPQQRETGAAEIAREQQESLIHRMSFGVQEMLSDAISLERRKQVKTADYRHKVDVIALTLAGIMTTAIATLAYLIGRSIITPLVRLRQETEIVGSGNLDHRVGTSANDELGELSRDFDRMLERLQQVTTSREALQREIEIRTNAEHSLRKSEQSLKKAQ